MHITELTVTEGNSTIRYAQHCPSGEVIEDWLKKILYDLVIAPATERLVLLAGTPWTLDRAYITSVVVTRSA